MELIGTNFAITIGSWRLRLGFAIEETDDVAAMRPPAPHRVRVVSEDYARRQA